MQAGRFSLLILKGFKSFVLWQTRCFRIFFATIEIACTLLIVWFAWKWKESEPVATPGN